MHHSCLKKSLLRSLPHLWTCSSIQQKGSVLILVIMIMMTLTTFGGILLGMVHARFIHYQVEMDRAKALYIAEAGISYSIWELKMKQDKENNGIGIVDHYDFGGGYFRVKHDPQTKEIMSSGIYNDVERRVVIVYESN